MQPVIQTIELTKIYKDFWGRGHVRALEGLNLEVQPGEVFGLLGPNGSGKTTTVKLLLGLLFPTRGVVQVFGNSPREINVKERMGYMPEESHLYDYLNARETLDFFGRLFGLNRTDRDQRSEALIDMVGLGRARNRPIGEFSKGMARRIGIAQALINDPDLLILDEPTTGLDPIGTREIKDLIATLKERGKTIFLCSHLLADVEQVCDRIAILYGGKMRISGDVNELLVEDNTMQIRMPALPPEGIASIENLIRKYVQSDRDFEIAPSERRLEDFFLSEVKKAKKEQVSTAGAESGTGAASFLSREEESPEKLIEDLTQAGRQKITEQEEKSRPVPVEKEGKEDKEDRELIEQLSQKARYDEKNSTEKEKAETKEETLADEDKNVRYDMLENLLRKDKEKEEKEKEEEEAKDNKDGKST